MEWQPSPPTADPVITRLPEWAGGGRAEPVGHRPLDDQAEAAVQTRMVIGQAVGILMQRDGLTSDGAFALLIDTSQRTNVKLRQIARQLVDQVDEHNRGR